MTGQRPAAGRTLVAGVGNIFQRDDAHLFWRLKALAYLLATLHNRTANGAGGAPALGATEGGSPVILPDPVGRRDGSGIALRRQLAVIGGAGRVP